MSDYDETTYDYELERPALDLEDDAEDTLEVAVMVAGWEIFD